ncbi:MAG: NAD-dependent epimerase/dehydratase family protein [Polyangiaceae bacterium]|nr:NAD-dependent epimerase/dehydratase family protein [Polyangiaceae bacterium]
MRRILVCGHKSFAATGLVERLESAGFEVWTFGRGAPGRDGRHVVGPVSAIAESPHLDGSFDAVVNFIVLKNDTVAHNEGYIDALLRFCENHQVRHLIHISSVSVYPDAGGLVTESSPVERHPGRKGIYGAWKVATETRLLGCAPPGVRLSLVRPGFILAPGLANPIIGNAFKLPGTRTFLLGNPRSVMPLVARDHLHDALVRILAESSDASPVIFLLVSGRSPTKLEYLEACDELLGVGTRLVSLPKGVWLAGYVAGWLAESALPALGRKISTKLRGVSFEQRFDPSETERRLGMTLDFDWRSLLTDSMDNQRVAPALPFEPPVAPPRGDAASVSIIGFGRIVKQKHLPALRACGFSGRVRAFDLWRGKDPDTEIDVEMLENPEDAGAGASLVVVATPGAAHHELAPLADAAHTLLVEKPLCTTAAGLEQWMRATAGQRGRVLVCHNYRYKANTLEMLRFMKQINSGSLVKVSLDFESPPVAFDSAAWLRRERASRTLLLDYGLHFLDLACMFQKSGWSVADMRYQLNGAGETSVIEGTLRSPAYPVSFILRQGFGRKVCSLVYSFQNYELKLGFFPDFFVARTANENPIDCLLEAVHSGRATAGKVHDKLTGRDSDLSHAWVYSAALTKDSPLRLGIDLVDLAGFYQVALDLAERVYRD